MKKGIIIIAALGLLAVVSCKKDHSCTCTTTYTSTTEPDYTFKSDTTYKDMKTKDAEAACNSNDATYTTVTTSAEVECSLN